MYVSIFALAFCLSHFCCLLLLLYTVQNMNGGYCVSFCLSIILNYIFYMKGFMEGKFFYVLRDHFFKNVDHLLKIMFTRVCVCVCLCTMQLFINYLNIVIIIILIILSAIMLFIIFLLEKKNLLL